jgi:hypothetical protein
MEAPNCTIKSTPLYLKSYTTVYKLRQRTYDIILFQEDLNYLSVALDCPFFLSYLIYLVRNGMEHVKIILFHHSDARSQLKKNPSPQNIRQESHFCLCPSTDHYLQKAQQGTTYSIISANFIMHKKMDDPVLICTTGKSSFWD